MTDQEVEDVGLLITALKTDVDRRLSEMELISDDDAEYNEAERKAQRCCYLITKLRRHREPPSKGPEQMKAGVEVLAKLQTIRGNLFRLKGYLKGISCPPIPLDWVAESLEDVKALQLEV